MKKTGFNGYGYDFSADYDATDVDDIVDIHKYLIKKNNIVYMKIFGFVKKMFFVGLAILSSLTNANSLSCTSMNNQECRVGPQFINVNGDEPVFFPFNFKTSKCNGSCNNINYPDAKICVPDVAKILTMKVFNLMSRTNETRYIEWHLTCKYECKFGENMHYTCIACITIDSIMRTDKKKSSANLFRRV